MEAMATTTSTTTTTEAKPLIGDIVEDGQLNLLDLVVLQKHLLNIQSITNEQSSAADLNGDKRINIFDLALLKRIILQS